MATTPIATNVGEGEGGPARYHAIFHSQKYMDLFMRDPSKPLPPPIPNVKVVALVDFLWANHCHVPGDVFEIPSDRAEQEIESGRLRPYVEESK